MSHGEQRARVEAAGQQSARAVEEGLARGGYDNFAIERDIERVTMRIPRYVRRHQ
jgi:hypothetical protein